MLKTLFENHTKKLRYVTYKLYEGTLFPIFSLFYAIYPVRLAFSENH